MFAVLDRSWKLTKLSFRVVLEDKELLAFPLLGGIFSILFAVAILYPSVFLVLQSESETQLNAISYVAMFLTYMGLAFIATFFNVCVVYTTKIRFEGGNATFMESIRFASSRIGKILAWAALSATVGMLLHALDRAAKRAGGAGEVVIGILRSILGMAWTVVTLFVVPAMVYENVGPFDAIKRSAQTLKRTWGESIVRHYGLGLIQGLLLFLGVLIAIALFAALGSLGGTGMVIAFLLVLIYFVGVILLFNVLNGVFNTALFVYADSGQLPGTFDEEVMTNAFRVS